MGIPIEAIGSGGRMTLLWENPSPSSRTSGGGVDLDLSAYDYLIVVAYHSISRTKVYEAAMILIDGLAYEVIIQASSEPGTIAGRTFTATKTRFSYGNGFYGAMGGGSGGANDCGIPVKLYGVKL